MAYPVIMPKQGQSVEICILTKWFKQKGEKVFKGELLFSYETDKATFEEEANYDGILLDVFFNEGDEVPVLEKIALIGNEGESTGEFKKSLIQNIEEVKKEEIKEEIKKTEVVKSVINKNVGNDAEIKISPRAKKLAEQLGVNYKNIVGTGSNSRITEQDIFNIAGNSQGVTKPAKETMIDKNPDDSGDFVIKEISNVRKIISVKMHQSLQNTAQLTLHSTADASSMLAIRSQIKNNAGKSGGSNITINDMVCYASMKALMKYPDINSHFLGDKIKYFNKVHLGFAADTPKGLMVPTVRNASDMSAAGLSAEIKRLSELCRSGKINPELLSGASFTVTNLGKFGIEIFTPIINPPQVAILGVNTIIYRYTKTDDNKFGFVPYIGLSLTFDHRAVDGAGAAAFLQEVALQIKNIDNELPQSKHRSFKDNDNVAA
ncbi:MAG: dihydrolipoamide acetyltransferase family protein [Elusimicrobia bacterium]|nr:dihydrolipoamide acetyltransferase family protein [Elusimicrobiota bacterium]